MFQRIFASPVNCFSLMHMHSTYTNNTHAHFQSDGIPRLTSKLNWIFRVANDRRSSFRPNRRIGRNGLRTSSRTTPGCTYVRTGACRPFGYFLRHFFPWRDTSFSRTAHVSVTMSVLGVVWARFLPHSLRLRHGAVSSHRCIRILRLQYLVTKGAILRKGYVLSNCVCLET